MSEKMLYFPNQNLPELNLTVDITPEYIQQVVEQWEEQPPDDYYKLILRAEEAGTENGN